MLRRTLCIWRPIIIKMPALSPTMEKGTITEWAKKVGDLIKSDELIMRVQTDKAAVDFNHVGDDCYLARIVAETNDKVEVGQPVGLAVEDKAELDGDEVKNWKAPAAPKKPEAAKPAAAPKKPQQQQQQAKPEPKAVEKKQQVQPQQQSSSAKPAVAATSSSHSSSLSEALHASIERSGPAVMRLAASLNKKQLEDFFGADGKKKGSGMGGRFTKGEVLAAFPKVNFDAPSTESPLYVDPNAVNTSATGAGGADQKPAAAEVKKPYKITQQMQPGEVFNFKKRDDQMLAFLISHSH